MLISIDPDTYPWYAAKDPNNYWERQDKYRLAVWKEEIKTYQSKINQLIKG